MRRLLIVSVVVCSLPYLGCASKSGSNKLATSSGSALSTSSGPAPFNDPRYRKLVREVEQAGGTTAIPQQPESAVGKLGSAVKKATSSVVGALTPSPKVVKASDPVSLASMPDKINADVFYQAGRLAESKGNRDAAIKQYVRVLEQDPNHLAGLISLARLRDREDDFPEAQRLYRKAIAVAPESAMAYNDLGLCLARCDRHEESIVALRQAISLEPNRTMYRNNLATVLVDLGRNDEAWNELLGAHSPAEAHYNLGYLLYQNGNQSQARRHFALAYEQDPKLSAAKSMLAQLGDTGVSPATQPVRASVRGADVVASRPAAVSRMRTNATPVAMVLSPPELRRIPPTDLPEGHEPPKPPPVRLHEPRSAEPEFPVGPPVAPPQPQSGTESPGPTVSETMVLDDEELELPTPKLLDEVALK